jgi:mercuric ion transport protein
MKEFAKQCASMAGAGFAGACCLGVAGALSILSAVGAGFLINDAFLIPMFLGFCALSVGLLYSSARAHGSLAPFWVGLGGAILAFSALWFAAPLVYAGLAVLVASSAWDFWSGRRAVARKVAT